MTADELASVTLEHLRAIPHHAERPHRTLRPAGIANQQPRTGHRGHAPRPQMYGDIVEQHARIDQLAARVERIERRLELNDVP
jgi:hypothetical protein